MDIMDISAEGQKLFSQVEQEIKGRAYRASNELRNASQYVLRGQRTGRRYRVPFTGGKRRKPRYYTASAPGESPALRTGGLRSSFWQRPYARIMGGSVTVYLAIESQLKYPAILNRGSKHIQPRPIKKPVIERAKNAIIKIYKAPYTLK